MKLSTLEELAIVVLDQMANRDKTYDELNAQIRKLMGDFPTNLQSIDEHVGSAVMALLDSIVGDAKLASYYLYECVGRLGHGGGIVCCEPSRKKPWRLRNADDLRKYLLHTKTCPGIKREKDAAKAKGGHARAGSLSPERRKEIARQGAQARWSGA